MRALAVRCLAGSQVSVTCHRTRTPQYSLRNSVIGTWATWSGWTVARRPTRNVSMNHDHRAEDDLRFWFGTGTRSSPRPSRVDGQLIPSTYGPRGHPQC